MLLLSEQLRNISIMSLQTGSELAHTIKPIIDPRNLTIPALYVQGPQLDITPSVLHVTDIREVGAMGYIIDDSSKLMGLDGLVRLQEIIALNFELIGIVVCTRDDHHIGKVEDFTFDPTSYTIQQLYIKQGMMRRITSTSHIIARSQIVAITNNKIIVDTASIHEKTAETINSTAAFVNPFRQSHSPQPDQASGE